MKILSLNVGLRPARRGGAKVELEHFELPLKNDLVPCYGDGSRAEGQVKVIHAYGFGSVIPEKHDIKNETEGIPGQPGIKHRGASQKK